MKNKKIKRLTILSFLLTILLTGGIFAYWASEVLGSSTTTATEITIGEGSEVTTTIALEEVSKTQGKLVPIGYANKADEVEKITIVFDIFLEAEEGGKGAVATLVVTPINIPHELLVINVLEHTESIVAGGDAVRVTIEVTLTEPDNVTEYNEVANQNYELSFKFEAVI